jgi:hypothetical protein
MHARRPTHMTRRVVAIVGALALLLTACSEGEGASSSPSATTTPTRSTPVGSAPGQAASPAASDGVATAGRLEIAAPGPGQTITLPAQIQYRITGVTIPPGSELRLTVRDLQPIDLPVKEPAGSITLPDDKSAFLPGKRDLTFQLVTRDGKALTPAVTVRDVTIEGRRGG